MKRLYEGATLFSAIVLIVTTAFIFIFNVNKKHQQVKNKNKRNSKIEKTEQKSSSQQQKIIEQNKIAAQNALDYYNSETKKRIEKEIADIKILEDDIEYYKKMADPLWRYYDEKTEQTEVYPGEYNKFGPNIGKN